MPVFLLRHCRALGQAPDAPLSEEGHAQAERLAGVLADLPVATIVASPWARAVASIAPLARARNVDVRTDARLTEYVLAPVPREDWKDELRRNFEDPARRLDGGESVAAAGARIAAVVAGLDVAAGAIVVTHGGLLTAYARTLDASVGFPFWERLGTPALFVVEGGAAREIPIAA